jgi:hypothetical protein
LEEPKWLLIISPRRHLPDMTSPIQIDAPALTIPMMEITTFAMSGPRAEQ